MSSTARLGILFVLFCLKFALVTRVAAQDALPLFKHFTTEEGLSSSELYSVIQDNYGNIWLGTDRGVVRYDGYEFKTFTTQDGLTDNTVFYLHVDVSGRLWMFTYSGRVFYFQDEKIIPYQYNDFLLKNSQNKIPNGFYVDSLQEVVVSFRGKGTFSIDSGGKYNFIDSVGFQIDSNYYINEFPGNYHVSSILGVNGNSTKAFVNHRFGEKKWQYEIVTSEFGRLCFRRTSTDEVIFSIGSSAFFVDKNGKVEKLFTLSGSIFALLEDDNQNLWVGSEEGLFYYDKDNWRNYSRLFLKGNMISAIFQDNENGYWFTTLENGVFYLPDDKIKSIEFSDSIKKPTSLATDLTGKLYIGCWTGAILEMQNQKVKTIYEQTDIAKKLPITDLTVFPGDPAIYVSRYYAGSIIGGKYNVYKIRNPIGVKTEYFRKENGDIYAAGSSFILSIKSDSIYISDLLSQRVNTIVETNDGRLLIGCNRGVFYYDERTKRETPYKKEFDEVRVDDIKHIGNKLLFATKGKGILFVVNDSVISVDETKGLASNLVGRMTVSGNEVWVATNKGVSHIEFDDLNSIAYKITNIHHSDGLLNDEISEIAVLNDTVYVATNSGISFFSATADFTNTISPKIYISSIKMNTKKIIGFENLIFPHDSNNLQISFNAISFKSFEKITYKYLLIHDKDTITSTTMNREVEFLSLAPGNYYFSVMAMNKSGVWSDASANFNFVIRPAWWQSVWFKVGISLLITAIVFFYYKSQLRKLREKLENEQVQASLQLTAIRAQMNPHFIFNVMNSIRIYMQSHDLKSAEKYLTSFSKLVRYVLDNSDKQVVSLEAELNSLRNYVELEMQQFESGFEFRIDVEEGIELSDYELPSLLLQPFVENSIKHGISKMKGKGRIIIDIRRKDDNLLIAIEDNGIGFEEAKEWNIKNREPHESRGTKIIFQRIEAYNKLFRKNIKAEYRDLRSENGTLSGTRVEVEI